LRRRLALFLLCLASFMAVVDNTIVTIALPVVRRVLRGRRGLAIVATVAAAVAASGGGESLLAGLRWGLVVCGGIVTLALPITLFGLRSR
jgi:hypothetical protein